MKKQSTMTAKEFERRFDEGEDITPYIDKATIRRPGLEARRVNVDFPEWVISTLDAQSKRIGVSRQSLIKLWISERIQQEEQSRAMLAAAQTRGGFSCLWRCVRHRTCHTQRAGLSRSPRTARHESFRRGVS